MDRCWCRCDGFQKRAKLYLCQCSQEHVAPVKMHLRPCGHVFGCASLGKAAVFDSLHCRRKRLIDSLDMSFDTLLILPRSSPCYSCLTCEGPTAGAFCYGMQQILASYLAIPPRSHPFPRHKIAMDAYEILSCMLPESPITSGAAIGHPDSALKRNYTWYTWHIEIDSDIFFFRAATSNC